MRTDKPTDTIITIPCCPTNVQTGYCYTSQLRHAAKTPTYPVMCPFPLFVALGIYVITVHQHYSYRPSGRQTDT